MLNNNTKDGEVKLNKFNNCHNFDWKAIFLLKISSFKQFDAWLNQLEGWNMNDERNECVNGKFMPRGFPIHSHHESTLADLNFIMCLTNNFSFFYQMWR